jgi:hypothetical protein
MWEIYSTTFPQLLKQIPGVSDYKFWIMQYQAKPLQQQNNQPTMEIGAAVAANDNSEQTAIENNTHS